MKTSLLRGERGRVLLAVMLASFLPAIELTALATVSTNIAADVDGLNQPAWLFSGYVLAHALAVPLAGKLADSAGRRVAIIAGLGVFAAASLLCGLAWGAFPLILGRTIQGAGSGIIMASCHTIVADIFDIAERGRGAAYVATIWAVGGLIGPVIGGLFVEYSTWRWLFLINIPLGLLSIWFFATQMREPHRERADTKVDYLGIALLALAASALMIALNEGGSNWGWGSPISIALIASFLAGVVALIYVERRVAEPIMPLWVFRSRIRVSAHITGFLIGAWYLAVSIYVPIYAQTVQGHSPSEAGMVITAMAFGWPVGCVATARLYPVAGFRPTIVVGGLIVTAGLVPLALIDPTTSLLVMVCAGFLIEFGFGFAATTALVAEQSSVQYAERGVAMGVGGLIRSMGQVVGAAGFGAIVNSLVQGGSEAQSSGDDGMFATAEALDRAIPVVFVFCLAAVVPFMLAAWLMPKRISESVDTTNPWSSPPSGPVPSPAHGEDPERSALSIGSFVPDNEGRVEEIPTPPLD